jgi:hypothetical protein
MTMSALRRRSESEVGGRRALEAACLAGSLVVGQWHATPLKVGMAISLYFTWFQFPGKFGQFDLSTKLTCHCVLSFSLAHSRSGMILCHTAVLLQLYNLMLGWHSWYTRLCYGTQERHLLVG